jgi:hypothetical protein
LEKTACGGALWSVLLTKHYAGDQMKKDEMGGASSTYGERTSSYRVLVGEPEGKRPLGRPRRTEEEENIKVDLQFEMGECTELMWMRKGTGGGLL